MNPTKAYLVTGIVALAFWANLAHSAKLCPSNWLSDLSAGTGCTYEADGLIGYPFIRVNTSAETISGSASGISPPPEATVTDTINVAKDVSGLNKLLENVGSNYTGDCSEFIATSQTWPTIPLEANSVYCYVLSFENGSNIFGRVAWGANAISSSSFAYSLLSEKPEISIKGGYIKLDLTYGITPPSSDCSMGDHEGRLIVDTINSKLFICTQSGWVEK